MNFLRGESSSLFAIQPMARDALPIDLDPEAGGLVKRGPGAIDPERGWGLAGETWSAMESLGRYGGHTWFRLGDRDIGTHLYRTQRLADGATLTEVTAEITRAWGLGLRLLPATDGRLETRVTVRGEGEIGFQEYFVGRQHSVPVTAVRFAGVDAATPASGVLDAINVADVVVIAPSNPIVSIEPVLAIPGVREAVSARRSRTVAVSPIVAGAALKGPADRMLRELGHEPSVVGVARLYAGVASVLVVDDADAASSADVAAEGIECVVVPTVMSSPDVAAALARVTVQIVDVAR